MPVKNSCDILIIGGGLAGAMAGYHLANLGYDVMLIEREAGAHHKVCGEYLSPETFAYLATMGIDLDGLGAAKITHLSLHSRHFQGKVSLAVPARSLSRFVLDEICLERATTAGCRVHRGVRAETISKSSPEADFNVQTSSGSITCKTIFLATGKHEIKGINHRAGREHGALGFKTHIRLSEQNQKILGQNVALYFFRGGYAGLSAIESGFVNLCFIVDRGFYKESGNSFEAVLKTMFGQNPQLKNILVGAEFLWPHPLALADLPYGYVLSPKETSSLPEGLFPLGDQFAVIPSLTGSGMAIALYTAHSAVEQYHLSKNAGVIPYVEMCARQIKKRMTLAYPLHALTRLPLLADVTVGLLKYLPQLTLFFLKKTRLPVCNFIPKGDKYE